MFTPMWGVCARAFGESQSERERNVRDGDETAETAHSLINSPHSVFMLAALCVFVRT